MRLYEFDPYSGNGANKDTSLDEYMQKHPSLNWQMRWMIVKWLQDVC